MIELKKLDDKDIYLFGIKGDIDEKSVNGFFEKLKEIYEEQGEIKMLGIIHEVSGPGDFIAFSENIKMKYEDLHVIKKYAVLSEKNWIETLLPLGSFFTPGITIKHFPIDEKNNAISWLESTDIKGAEPPISVNSLGENIYSFTLDRKFDYDEVIRLYNKFVEKANDGKIKLLAEIKGSNDPENVKILLKGIQVDFLSFGHIEKYAVITEKTLTEKLVKAADYMTPGLPIRLFSHEQKEKAIEWLKEF